MRSSWWCWYVQTNLISLSELIHISWPNNIIILLIIQQMLIHTDTLMQYNTSVRQSVKCHYIVCVVKLNNSLNQKKYKTFNFGKLSTKICDYFISKIEFFFDLILYRSMNKCGRNNKIFDGIKNYSCYKLFQVLSSTKK